MKVLVRTLAMLTAAAVVSCVLSVALLLGGLHVMRDGE